MRPVSGKRTPGAAFSASPRLPPAQSSCTSSLVTAAHCARGPGAGDLGALLLHWLIRCLRVAPRPRAGPAGRAEAPRVARGPAFRPGTTSLPRQPTGPLHPAEEEAPRPGYPNGTAPGAGGRGGEKGVSLQTPALTLPSPHLRAAPPRDCRLKMAFPPPPLLASGFSRANRPSTRSFLPPSAGDDSFARASIYLEKVDLAPGCSKPGRAISEAEQGQGWDHQPALRPGRRGLASGLGQGGIWSWRKWEFPGFVILHCHLLHILVYGL